MQVSVPIKRLLHYCDNKLFHTSNFKSVNDNDVNKYCNNVAVLIFYGQKNVKYCICGLISEIIPYMQIIFPGPAALQR